MSGKVPGKDGEATTLDGRLEPLAFLPARKGGRSTGSEALNLDANLTSRERLSPKPIQNRSE